MDNPNLYKKIEQHVKSLFIEKDDPALVFHNLKHTQVVVKRTKEIAGHYALSERDMLVLFAAAWFHDVGHLFTEPGLHEEKSAELMRNFMVANNMDEALVSDTEKCILATKLPRNPTTLLQQIICDADTYHFGTDDFKLTNKLILQELQLKDNGFDKSGFNKDTLEMLQSHTYYTAYCKDLLSRHKKRNMKKIKRKQSEIDNEEAPVTVNQNSASNLANLEKDKSGLMSKGIQTMLRLTSENHLKLSDMADNKANILISVNSIIISVILSVLLRKLQEEPYLTVPAIIFLAVAVTTIVISILATRPKINTGTFTHQDIIDKKTNLLFFGNFHKATFDDYNVAMRNMMVDTDYLYGSLIKDIYHLGTVLGRKYKLIRLAYNIFMIGIVVSVIAFALAVSLHTATPPQVVNGSGSPL